MLYAWLIGIRISGRLRSSDPTDLNFLEGLRLYIGDSLIPYDRGFLNECKTSGTIKNNFLQLKV